MIQEKNLQLLGVGVANLKHIKVLTQAKYLTFFSFDGAPNLLLEHVGLPHVLVLTVHLVNHLGWMGKGDNSTYLDALLLKVRVN